MGQTGGQNKGQVQTCPQEDLVGLNGVVIGIDPGATGGIGAISWETRKCLSVDDWPGDERGASELIDCYCNRFEVALCGIELQQSMNGPGGRKASASGLMKLAWNYGVWCALAASAGWRVELARPAQWKRHQGLLRGSKADSLTLARRRWPEADLKLKKHDGRAEALLIADYVLDLTLKGRG